MKTDLGKKAAVMLLLALLTAAIPLPAQSPAQWRQDIDFLAALIEKYHPLPWARIAKEEFLRHKERIKADLEGWTREKITVELMRLVSGLLDGHTAIRFGNQAGFNLWFPVRMERFSDGIFLTGGTEARAEELAAKVLKIGDLDARKAYERVGAIVPRDSPIAVSRLTSNFLSNAVVLKALGIIGDEKKLDLEILTKDGGRKKSSLLSAPWMMRSNWTWNKASVPTNDKIKTIYDGRQNELPLYLIRLIPEGIPYWFEYVPGDKLLFLQFNEVTDWKKDPFADFTKKLFRAFDENVKNIDKFVIDLRFNEGGNGYLLPPFVQEFILRRDALPRGKLFIITGDRTFSAAPNFIGQMLKQTSAITVGDIAPGPLNWCSDVIDFILPNSRLGVTISTMYWMTGHATDKRGYYPPDYYVPSVFKDYASLKDKPLEAILSNQAVPLKDILINEGWGKFEAELKKRKELDPENREWFPYTSFDLVRTAYLNLLPAGKSAEATELLKLNAALYPEEIRSWYALAETGQGLGNIDLALSAYEKLMTLEPGLADVRDSYCGLRLLKAFNEGGTEALAGLFKELKKSHPLDVSENTLNVMAYQKLRQKKTAEALEIFKLNVTLHPDYANGYDSLGEAYAEAGDKENAIWAYKKALELDPNMSSAKAALKNMEEI
jgi:tetratricopeptide (TPR) repeat protein